MNLLNQTVLVPGRPDVGGSAVQRTVRDVRIWDGRTVGWVRHRGAVWTVQHYPKNNHWLTLSGVNWSDVASKENADAEHV